MSSEQELQASFFRILKFQLNRCLASGMECKANAIRAHSIQNSQSLDLLCRDGHVKGITVHVQGSAVPVVKFVDIGRNKASTFTGFCSIHDAEIFRLIDTSPFDSSNDHHLFLVAYRAVARELHTVMEAASKLQSGFVKRVELGLDDQDQRSPASMLALAQMVKAYETYQYKFHFDKALHSGNYDEIAHNVLRINHPRPTVAVSSLFSIDQSKHGHESPRVALNVFPLSQGESVATFSYLKSDLPLVRDGLHKILLSTGDYQKYELSKLILNSCENFVLSPQYFDEWNTEKESGVTSYFLQTLYESNLSFESELLFLF